MILLDANVVSEAMRHRPEPRVIDWLDAQPSGSVALASVTVAEILYGIRRLPEGRCRGNLQRAFDTFLARGLRERILSFDHAAADAYSWIMVDRQRSGRRIEVLDAMVAGIARSRGAEIATRDVTDFADCGVPILNPWE